MAVSTWATDENLLGASVPGSAADALNVTQAGVTLGPLLPAGTLRKFRDTTGKYGEVTCIYLPGVASLAVGDVVSYNVGNGVDYTGANVTRWAGAANTGIPLAVATTPNTSTSTWSWYVVEGQAPVNISGTVAAGDRAFWQATATLSSTPVAGKQVLGITAVSANGTPGAGQAVYNLAFPIVQSQIT